MHLTPLPLDSAHTVYGGLLPVSVPFDPLWNLHPVEFPVVRMIGKAMPTPRWTQAYGRDYRYAGNVARALPVPLLLQPLLALAQGLDNRINGMLINWYDGDLGHYIGKHRDAADGLVAGAPILTLSLGAPRIFRFRRYRGAGIFDFDTGQYPVIAFGTEVNRVFSHEVIRGAGRRISVTARAFR